MTPETTTTVLLIAGMRDARCRDAIEAAVGRVNGVREVQVNLYRARVTIVHERACEIGVLIRVVVSAGYGVTVLPEGLGVNRDTPA